jgi:ribonuclease BN (tRNA processing enzyme)
MAGKEAWMLDIGPGSLQHLAQAGQTYRSLNRVFVSHNHPDHISDLLPLLQALNYTPAFTRLEPLIIYGPHSVKEYLQINLGYAPALRPRFPFRFVVLEDGSHIKEKEWQLTAKKMSHSTFTIGFRFIIGEACLVYSADTEPCPEVIELAQDSDLLILESSFTKQQPCPGHLTTKQAGEIAKIAGAKRLLLTHFYPSVDLLSASKKESEVRDSGYEGEIIFAEDLLHRNSTTLS